MSGYIWKRSKVMIVLVAMALILCACAKSENGGEGAGTTVSSPTSGDSEQGGSSAVSRPAADQAESKNTTDQAETEQAASNQSGEDQPAGEQATNSQSALDQGAENQPAAEQAANLTLAEQRLNAQSTDFVALPELSGLKTGAELVFSAESGCYEDEFLLEISNTPAASQLAIYYTTDGSNPLEAGGGFRYEGGIAIANRSTEACIVNAVETALYDAANVKVNAAKNGFDTQSKLPDESAVDKCTVIRAVGIDAAGNATEVVTATYFLGSMDSHVEGASASSLAAREAGLGENLLVISLTADFDDIFGYEKGIYVKGAVYDQSVAALVAAREWLDPDTSRRVAANYNQKGRAWERRIHADFFETDGTRTELVLSQDCGIRIQGNYSRSDLQKGFRLYAREDYGTKNFKYPLFGASSCDDSGKPLSKFKTLILRNGGNCAFTTKYSADYWAYMSAGTAVETLASRPAVVYLNGEYWGLYVLEEDYSDNYFQNKHGVAKEDVVLYKGDAEALALGYKLDLGELPERVGAEDFYFKGLLNFFASHKSCENEEDFALLCKYVDPDSVRDYFAVETWINNKWDWPGKNWSMWKVASIGEKNGISGAQVADDGGNEYADGRWRFCFYDLEFGGVSGEWDATVNTIKEDNYKTYGLLDMDTSNPAVLCFAYCMTNAGFREDFYAKLRELSDDIFERQKALAVLDGFCSVYSPLYDQFFSCFPGAGSAKNSIDGGYASNKCIADFLKKRADNIEKMISWCEKHYAK